MFNGLPQQERSAFFNLLDEYFESRPHHLPQQANTNQAHDSLIRAIGSVHLGKLAGSTIGNSISNTQGAVASSFLPPARGGPPPPPSLSSKPSLPIPSGLQMGKAFGGLKLGSQVIPHASHLLTKNTGGVTPTPAASQPATSDSFAPPKFSPSSTAALQPPPTRHAPAAVSSTTATVATAGGIGMAEALYDYGDSNDPDDLIVVEGEQFILLEKISDDWYRGQKMDGSASGIVPTSYVKQL